MCKLSSWNVQTRGIISPSGAEEKLQDCGEQPDRVEERVGGVRPPGGVSGEPGRAEQSLVPHQHLQHTAETLPWPGGASGLQAVSGHRHGPAPTQREDVSEWDEQCNSDSEVTLENPYSCAPSSFAWFLSMFSLRFYCFVVFICCFCLVFRF